MSNFDSDQLCCWEDTVIQTSGTNYLNQIYQRLDSKCPKGSFKKSPTLLPKRMVNPMKKIVKKSQQNISDDISKHNHLEETKQPHLRNSTEFDLNELYKEQLNLATERHFPDYFKTENPILNKILSERPYLNQQPKSYLFAMRQNSIFKSTKTSLHCDNETVKFKTDIQPFKERGIFQILKRNNKNYLIRPQNSSQKCNLPQNQLIKEKEIKNQLLGSGQYNCNPIHQTQRVMRQRALEFSFKRYYKSQYNCLSFSRSRKQEKSSSETELALLSTKISKNILNSLQYKY